jgi:hypothetical protein
MTEKLVDRKFLSKLWGVSFHRLVTLSNEPEHKFPVYVKKTGLGGKKQYRLNECLEWAKGRNVWKLARQEPRLERDYSTLDNRMAVKFLSTLSILDIDRVKDKASKKFGNYVLDILPQIYNEQVTK